MRGPQGLDRQGRHGPYGSVAQAPGRGRRSLESFHFALGQDDAYIICDLPDNVTAAAVSMSAAASGMLVSRMVALLTAEEVDRAAAMKLQFDPRGS